MTLREDIAMVLEDAYWLGSDAAIGRCEDDSSMLIARGYTDRIMAHIDRLLAERDMDALLDGLHPESALRFVERGRTWSGEYKWFAGVDILNAETHMKDTSTGTGPTRMDALRDAVAKAKGERR